MIRSILQVFRGLFWIFVWGSFIYAIFTQVIFAAETVPTYLQQAQDPTSSLGGMFEKVFKFILYIAVGFGSIGAAWGLAEANGIIGKKESAADKIKTGFTVVAVSGVMLAILSFFANLA